MMALESERLNLRGWYISDLDDLHEFTSNKKVADLAGFKVRNNKEESLQLLQRFIIDSNDSLWAIELKESNKVIGWIEVHEPAEKTFTNSKEIGATLSEEYWGQALIPEAIKQVCSYLFIEEKISIAVWSHYVYNVQSEKAIIKAGFNLYLEENNKKYYYIHFNYQ
ncbi:GNAT family N-acetyltransferase [Clostridium saccharoperbutylacetonicum]|uniref:GNAT family N-acetyltransferase n=1 Tax=Clostridium saccharoperbutylacetonicum TaxID=36745 RepID=UPI0039E8A7D8